MLATAAVLAGALVAPFAPAQSRIGAGGNPKGDPRPTPERMLINRCTYGWTPQEQALLFQLGYNGYLEYHLAYDSIDDSELDLFLRRYTTLFMEPYELYAVTRGQIVSELSEALCFRMWRSKRQLFERVVEFWTDHFSMNILDSDVTYLKPVDDREVIRRHALGRFRDLLWESAHSPAMLVYLDNNTNRAGAPNENYARELLELHTLGVDGGYTQQDVIEVARCFTGWTVYGGGTGNLRGKFRYVPSLHDNGPKRVLGYDIPAGGGIRDGEIVLDILVNHPNTARYVSTKLAKWLWGENPPEGIVAPVIAAYNSTSGDIKAMVRALLNKAALMQAPPKFKRPMHLFVNGLRAYSPTVSNLNNFRTQHLAAAGHSPYSWGPPDGYPDTLLYWSGLLLPRWNFGFSMMANQIGGLTPDMGYLTGGATRAADIADRINQLAFGGSLPRADRDALVQYMLPDPVSNTRTRDGFALALALPGFQWF